VIFALRPVFDRARPGIVGDMTRALEALVNTSDDDLQPGSVVFLRS